jgi:hypothetical protein
LKSAKLKIIKKSKDIVEKSEYFLSNSKNENEYRTVITTIDSIDFIRIYSLKDIKS